MKKFRNIAKCSVHMLAVAAVSSMFSLVAQPASAQSRADRETCAEAVGIQTRHDGRNIWIKRRVSGKTYSAFLRCTDAVAMKQAQAKPNNR